MDYDVEENLRNTPNLEDIPNLENFDDTETAFLEVYEFPADCVSAELSYHFSLSPYLAECKTPLDKMLNPKSSTFVLEFSTSEINVILKQPVHLLDHKDPKSEIKVSRLEVRRCAQVLVTCEHEMSSRMIRNYFSKFGEIEDCCHQPYAILLGDYRIVLTFKHQSVAKEVATVSHHKIGPAVCVHTQLLKDDIQTASDELSSPSGTSLSLNFDIDSVSSILPAYKPAKIYENLLPTHLHSNIYEAINVGENLLTLNVMEQQPQRTLPLYTKEHSTNEGDTYESLDLHSNQTNSQKPLKPPLHVPPSAQPCTPIPTVNLHCCIQVNNCIVRLVKGDIGEHAADVLVHSSGFTSNMLNRKCNTRTTFIEMIQTVKVQPSGTIAVSTAPNLPAKYLFGFRLVDCDDGASLQKFVVASLLQCDKLRVKSVAFPALGTGLYGESPKMMASVLTKSMVEYMKTHSHSSLEIIDIVIFQQHMIDDYRECLKEAASKSRENNFAGLSLKSTNIIANVYQVPNRSQKLHFDNK